MLPDVQAGELTTCERDRDIRIFVSLPGLYSLANRRNARGERRTFACRAVNISESSIALIAPVTGELGQRVIADIDRLGKIEGAITHILSRGFVMSIVKSEGDHAQLADRIEWIEKHKNHDAPDQRAHARFAPKNPYSRLLLADGTLMTCLIIDLSETGAGISADVEPKVGTVLAVGAIVGRVVRRFVGGFALKFAEPQSRDSVETMATVNDQK
jgi:hypothetical protein